MGYLTQFNLTIYDENKNVIMGEEEEEIVVEIEEDFDLCLYEDMKWYDHIEDMKEFSNKYPKYSFYFCNYGQEKDDIHCSVFHNGKAKTLSISPVFPELETMLNDLQ